MKKWTPPQVLAVLTYFNDVFFSIRANDQICEEHQIKQKEKRKTFGLSQELLMLFTNRGRWIDQTALLLAVHE